MTRNELLKLCKKGRKQLTKACVPKREQQIALLIDELEEALNEVKTYGKLYYVSPKVAIEKRDELEKKLYEDICKYLMKNGVLVIYSEGTPFEITYGWKLKGVAQDA